MRIDPRARTAIPKSGITSLWPTGDRRPRTLTGVTNAMTVEATGTGRYIDRMLFKRGQRHDIQSPLVGGRQHHVGGSPVVVGPQPVDCCHAPSVPGYQPGEPVPEHRGAQIVADSLLVLEEFKGHHRADGVARLILGTGMACLLYTSD